MESVSVRELKNNPSVALRHARDGAMVVVTNRDAPEALLVGLEHLRVPDVKRLRIALAASLFRDGVITTGTAARIAGVDRADMFEMLSRLGIPIDGNVNEVAQDVDVIHAWLKRTRKPVSASAIGPVAKPPRKPASKPAARRAAMAR